MQNTNKFQLTENLKQLCTNLLKLSFCMLIAEGLAQWLNSLPPNPEVPGSIPGLVEGWIFGWPSFPLKFTQLSILPGSVKWVPAYMDRFEAAARGAYICFRSAGGKLIIVKRLWACYMEKALCKCTTLLYFMYFLITYIGVCQYFCEITRFSIMSTVLEVFGILSNRYGDGDEESTIR